MADPLLDASAVAVFNALRSDGRVSVPLDALTKATGLGLAGVDDALDQLAWGHASLCCVDYGNQWDAYWKKATA